MSRRMLIFIVLAAAVSIAYFVLAVRFVSSLPWAIGFYALPVGICALLGYVLGVWRRGPTATNAIAVSVCLLMPLAVSVSIMSFICLHEQICP